MLYALTAHNGYWAQVMRADMAAGRSAQRVCSETYKAILMMGRGPKEAMRVTMEAAHFAGIDANTINW